MEKLLEAVRGALQLAMIERDLVRVTLRTDPKRGGVPRVLEGVVVELGAGGDGRERVVLGIAEDTQQVVLLERIERVARAE